MTSLVIKAIKALDAGRYDLATKYCKRSLRRDLTNFDAQHLLGVIALRESKPMRAVRELTHAVELRPDHAAVHNNLGAAYQGASRHRQSLKSFSKAVLLAPENLEFQLNLAKAAERSGQWKGARDAYALASNAFVEATLGHGRVSRILGDFETARDVLKPLLFGEFRLPAIQELSLVHEMSSGVSDVLTFLDSCVVENPGCVQTRLLAAEAQFQAGDSIRATQFYLGILSMDPGHRHSLWRLAGLGYFDSQEKIDQLEENKNSDQTTAAAEKADWHHTLFLAYEKLGLVKSAGRHLVAANECRFEFENMSFETENQRFQKIIETFDQTQSLPPSEIATDSIVPIFIVGMPRSGTSLVEQMLASHSMVSGAGELTVLPALLQTEGADSRYLRRNTQISVKELGEIRQSYLSALKAYARNGHFVVDKYPLNFLNLGIIHRLFPEAKIVWCQRSPMDTCFSCYKQFFTGTLPFSYDQKELIRYYRGYRSLMDYWNGAFGDKITPVSYERLIGDFEVQTKSLFASLQLPWEDEVLNFSSQQRMVKTQSAMQVRSEIYQGAVNAWEPYRSYLEPMLDELNRELGA